MENQIEKNMENEMETGIVGSIGVIVGLYWGYIGIMEKKMETTVLGLGFRDEGFGQSLCRSFWFITQHKKG